MSFIYVSFECQRVTCGRVERVEVDDLQGLRVPVGSFLPEGWGFDAHDGVNRALHCPAHREPPTPEELAAAERAIREREALEGEACHAEHR